MPEIGEPLSDRELEVLRCLSQGAGNKEIASELSISQNTVKVHLRNIYTKLGVSSRTEATAVALQRGVISLPGTDTDSGAEAPVTSATDTEVTAEPLTDPQAGEQRRWLTWRNAIFFLVIIIAIGVLVVGLNLQQAATAVTQTPAAAETVAFQPEELGENWRTLRALPEPRAGMATAAVGLDLYVIGGEVEGGVDESVLVYHTTEHQWEEAAAKPTPVTAATAVALFGEIFVLGGELADGQPTNVVEAYSPSNDSWRVIESLPRPIAGGLALTDGSFLYLIGGRDGADYLNSAYLYDPGENSWRPLPDMNHPRAFLTGGTITGNLYVVGGFNGQEELAVCEFFDPAAETWFACPDMLSPRTGAGAASIVNKLYVVGGGQAAETPVTYSERYDPEGETWNIINTPDLAETAQWTNFGTASVETRLFTLGGQRGETIVGDAYTYSPLVYQTFIPAASAGEE